MALRGVYTQDSCVITVELVYHYICGQYSLPLNFSQPLPLCLRSSRIRPRPLPPKTPTPLRIRLQLRPSTRLSPSAHLPRDTQALIHTFPHTCWTYFSTSAHSHSGFSSAAKWPPLSCCSNATMFPPFSSTCRIPGNSSYGKNEKPTGLDMYAKCTDDAPCSWRYGCSEVRMHEVNQYREMLVRMWSRAGVVSDHSRNFSPILRALVRGIHDGGRGDVM